MYTKKRYKKINIIVKPVHFSLRSESKNLILPSRRTQVRRPNVRCTLFTHSVLHLYTYIYIPYTPIYVQIHYVQMNALICIIYVCRHLSECTINLQLPSCAARQRRVTAKYPTVTAVPCTRALLLTVVNQNCEYLRHPMFRG